MEDHDKLLAMWDKYLESDAAEAYFKDIQLKQENNTNRFRRADSYFATLTQDQFDVLMERLIGEHTEELRDFWYKKSIMPVITNKMSFLFDYVFQHATMAKHYAIEDEKLYDEYATGFADEIAEYRGYVFQMYFGQGVAYGISKNKEKVFWGW